LWCIFTQSKYPCFPCDYTFYWHVICLPFCPNVTCNELPSFFMEDCLCMSLKPKLGALTWTWMNVFIDNNLHLDECHSSIWMKWMDAWSNTWMKFIHLNESNRDWCSNIDIDLHMNFQ
jgi:hypothetical protein